MGYEKKIKTIKGKKTKDVFLYALSTCGWCRMTKEYLKDLGVEYCYVDVDLLNENESKQVDKELDELGTDPTFPKIVIDKKIIISGFDEEAINEHLK